MAGVWVWGQWVLGLRCVGICVLMCEMFMRVRGCGWVILGEGFYLAEGLINRIEQHGGLEDEEGYEDAGQEQKAEDC